MTQPSLKDKVVKKITVYEQVKAPNGIVLNLPIKKVKSYKALGLSLRSENAD